MAKVTQAQFAGLPELFDGAMPQLLRPGDVLIHHSSKSAKYGDAYHASIMAYMPGGDILLNYHSAPSHNGVVFRSMTQFGDLATVFRPTAKPDYGRAAGEVAASFNGVGYSSGFNGIGRALRVPFHTSKYTDKTADRLEKYMGRDNHRPKNVICTELCVVSYQLAVANFFDPYYIKLDGKFLYPKTLEGYFLTNGAFWDLVGKVTGPASAG